jgi:EAL domain-containing protein (putative c-di-GMP-specific phosphodiesterase class I)
MPSAMPRATASSAPWPTGYEALARWDHPLEGPIPPAEFIDVAEGAGLITDLGCHVLDLSLATARQLLDDGAQFDQLKVDRTFVDGLDLNPRRRVQAYWAATSARRSRQPWAQASMISATDCTSSMRPATWPHSAIDASMSPPK